VQDRAVLGDDSVKLRPQSWKHRVQVIEDPAGNQDHFQVRAARPDGVHAGARQAIVVSQGAVQIQRGRSEEPHGAPPSARHR
jgi:hypothetical protein